MTTLFTDEKKWSLLHRVARELNLNLSHAREHRQAFEVVCDMIAEYRRAVDCLTMPATKEVRNRKDRKMYNSGWVLDNYKLLTILDVDLNLN